MAPRNGDYKLTVEMRMTRLEEQVSELRINHIPHLQISIDSLEEKVDKLNLTVSRWIGGGAVVLLIAQALWAYVLSR